MEEVVRNYRIGRWRAANMNPQAREFALRAALKQPYPNADYHDYVGYIAIKAPSLDCSRPLLAITLLARER